MNDIVLSTAPDSASAVVSLAARGRWVGGLFDLLQALGVTAVGLAGLAKAYAVDEFYESLSGWTILPTALRSPLSFALPAVEWGIFLVFVTDPARRRAAARAAAVLVAVFTSALLLESWVHGVPQCHCFGLLLAQERLVDGLPAMLLRNAVVVACLAPAWRRRVP